MIEFWPSLRTFAVILQLELVSFRLADYLIFGYFGCLCCVVLPCVVWRNCVINFTVLLCIIFIHMFYSVMKGIGLYQFAENLLSYIPTKYYWNRSTSDLVIAKSKRVNLFWNTVYYARKTLATNVYRIVSVTTAIVVNNACAKRSRLIREAQSATQEGETSAVRGTVTRK